MNGKTLSALLMIALLSIPFCAVSYADDSDAAIANDSKYIAYNTQGEEYYRTGSMITISEEVESFDGVIFSVSDIGDKFDDYYAGRCLISDIHSVKPIAENSYYVYFSDAGRIYYSNGSSVYAKNLSSNYISASDNVSHIYYVAGPGLNTIFVNDSDGKDIVVWENGKRFSSFNNEYTFQVGEDDVDDEEDEISSRLLTFKYSSDDGSFATIIDCSVTPDFGTVYSNADGSIDYEDTVGTIYGNVWDDLRDEDQVRFFVDANQEFTISVDYSSHYYDLYLVNRSGEVLPLIDNAVYDLVFDKAGEYYITVVSEGSSDSTLCAEYGLYLEGAEEKSSDFMPLAIMGSALFIVIFALFLIGSSSVRWK